MSGKKIHIAFTGEDVCTRSPLVLKKYALDLYVTRKYHQTHEAYVQVPSASRSPRCLQFTASGGWFVTTLMKGYHLLVLD